MGAANQLEKDGHRIDPASQKILWQLRNPWYDRDWIRGSELRRAAELSQNRQVYYRIETYLEPAGLVEEKERRREDDPRAFRLTDEGEQWVDAHEERLRAPASRMETQQLAREAMDEAEAAKESVQGYRKKLHRVKSDVDDLKEQSQENTDQIEEHSDRIGSLHKLAWGSANDIKDLRDSKADEQESRERLRSAKRDLQEENRQLRETLEDAQAHIETLQEENATLEERVDAIEEELGKTWTEKFRSR